jgi:hypothetical protein
MESGGARKKKKRKGAWKQVDRTAPRSSTSGAQHFLHALVQALRGTVGAKELGFGSRFPRDVFVDVPSHDALATFLLDAGLIDRSVVLRLLLKVAVALDVQLGNHDIETQVNESLDGLIKVL